MLRKAIENPDEFLRRLEQKAGPAAKKLLIAKLRPKLEPVVEKQGLEWGDVVPALELVDSVQKLKAAISDPDGFLRRLEHSAGPAAKKLLTAKLRPKLEPHVEKQGLEWDDVVPALELVDSVEELEAALADPEAFLQSLAHSMGPAAKKLLVAKLRPKLEPHLDKQGLQWDDVVPALELVDSVEELEAAIADPE